MILKEFRKSNERKESTVMAKQSMASCVPPRKDWGPARHAQQLFQNHRNIRATSGDSGGSGFQQNVECFLVSCYHPGQITFSIPLTGSIKEAA